MAAAQAHFASASLYVGDLHRDVTEAMLYEVFNSVGPVASIRVCRDSSSRKSLGYAYVNYHSVGDAERALDTLNYTHIKNVPCRLMWSHRDPSLRKSGAGNIFVKNLDRDIDNKALYDTFSLFGNILSCKVAQGDSGKSRGFGFVHYETEEAAETAIIRVNQMKIGSKTVYVGPFRKKSDRTSHMEDRFTNCYVKNIPVDWDEDKIREIFGEFGEVTSVALQVDKRGRRFGFVNFNDAESAKAAVSHLHQKKVKDTSEGEEQNEKEKSEVDCGKDEKEEGDGKVKTEEGAEESTEEKTAEEDSRVGREPNTLYVSRFQPRAERVAALKSKFDQSAVERQKNLGVNLYIKNIHDSVDDAALRDLFEPFGTITSARVMLDENGVSKGFAFVSFLSPDEATKAVTEMHLKLIEGKPLYVGLHERRDERMHRLQQKLRLPYMRRMPQGMPNQGGGGIQFGTPPPMYFGGGAMPAAGPAVTNNMAYPAPVGYPGGAGPMIWNRQNHHQMRSSNFPPHAGVPLPMGVGGGYPPLNPTGGPPMNHGVANPMNAMPMPGGPMQSMPGGMQRVNNRMAMSTPSGMGGVPSTNQSSVAGGGPLAALNTDVLATASDSMKKQILGERLFPLIQRLQPTLAGKITGMMLDMENTELIMLLESETQLRSKVDEALRVLHQAQAPVAPTNSAEDGAVTTIPTTAPSAAVVGAVLPNA